MGLPSRSKGLFSENRAGGLPRGRCTMGPTSGNPRVSGRLVGVWQIVLLLKVEFLTVLGSTGRYDDHNVPEPDRSSRWDCRCPGRGWCLFPSVDGRTGHNRVYRAPPACCPRDRGRATPRPRGANEIGWRRRFRPRPFAPPGPRAIEPVPILFGRLNHYPAGLSTAVRLPNKFVCFL